MHRASRRFFTFAAYASLAASMLASGACSDTSNPSDPPPPPGGEEDAQADGGKPERDGSTPPKHDGSTPPLPDGAAPVADGHPFGSHGFPYAPGVIVPSDSQTARDDATAQFYDAWKKKYLIKDCGPDRYYIATTLDGSGGGQGDTSITVSEGMGYGMLAAALMEGHDPDARKIFDGLYLFFRDHPSSNSPDLMAWNQVKGCGNNPTDGSDSATDGDLDIAYALVLASHHWPSGPIDYAAEARKVIAAVKTHDVNPKTKLVTLGDWAGPDDEEHYYGTRPSDFMTDHFRAFGRVTQSSDWDAVVDAHYSLVATMQGSWSKETGLLPDFISDTNTSAPKPARADFLEGGNDGNYAWNSCRVPWRLGTDFVVSGEARAKSALTALNAWVRKATGNSPGKIDAGYLLNGTPTTASIENALAFVAPFGVSAMVDASNQAWLDAIWKLIVSRGVNDDNYFGNSIKLLTMIVMSGNWWAP